jgi:glycosyltransferase involved in cell wall biosynthesis
MISPLLSVILPVYNAQDFINETIKSVLDQSFKDFELIIIDDGSTDNSENIILSFQDSRIKFFKNVKNLKLIETLNLGITNSKGKYIARIDADDIAYVDRFKVQIDFLELNPDYGLVGTFVKEFGDSDKEIIYPSEDHDIRYSMIFYNPFVHSSIMIRKSVLIENSLSFHKEMIHVEDYDLWIRILKYTKGKNIPLVLVKYRVHSQQISNVYQEIQRKNTFKIQLNYLIDLGVEYEYAEPILLVLNKRQVSIFLCLKILSNLENILIKIEEGYLRKRLYNKIHSETIDTILKQKNIKFKDFYRILSKRQFFNNIQIIRLATKIR